MFINRANLKGALGNIAWPFLTKPIADQYVRKNRGLVLTFHCVGNTPLPGVLDSLFVPEPEFARILDFIKTELVPLSPLEFLARMSENDLPSRATLITFDDCTRDTVAKGHPELLKRSLTALWFVCPGLIDADRTIPSLDLLECCMKAERGTHTINCDEQTLEFAISDRKSRVSAFKMIWPFLFRTTSHRHQNFLRTLRNNLGLPAAPSEFPLAHWDELRALSESGMHVGNHTQLHSTVAADGVQQFKSDVEAAYVRLRGELSQDHRIFCYPYGRRIDASPSARVCLQQCHTEYAFVTQGGFASERDGDRLNIRREDASYSLRATKLAPLIALFRSSSPASPA